VLVSEAMKNKLEVFYFIMKKFSINICRIFFSFPETRLLFLNYFIRFGRHNFEEDESLKINREAYYEASFNLFRTFYFESSDGS